MRNVSLSSTTLQKLFPFVVGVLLTATYYSLSTPTEAYCPPPRGPVKPIMSAHGKFEKYPLNIEPLLGLMRHPLFEEGKVGVEDRTYLQFLANHVNVTGAPRKVYVDVGANTFESSIGWMMSNYPLEFDQIYAWEANSGVTVIPPHLKKKIFFEEKMVGDTDGPNSVNLIRFLKDHVEKSDFVVMKLDIDGGEWDLVPQLIAGGVFPDLIDEFFVEIHYKHPKMNPYGWDKLTHSLEEARNMLQNLRDMGVYAHYWP